MGMAARAAAPRTGDELDDAFTGLAGPGGVFTVAGFGSLLSGEPARADRRPPRGLACASAAAQPLRPGRGARRSQPPLPASPSISGPPATPPATERSARSTFPDLRGFRPARLAGWRRVFAHTADVFFARGIARPATGEISSLSCEPCTGAEIVVALFEVRPSARCGRGWVAPRRSAVAWLGGRRGRPEPSPLPAPPFPAPPFPAPPRAGAVQPRGR
jgi:hypothetical protein